MSKAPSRSHDQFIVRLPDGMRDRIKTAAEANNRSMNAEIVATLEEKYPDDFHLRTLESALLSLRLALYADHLDRDQMRATLKEVEEDFGTLKLNLARGRRGE